AGCASGDREIRIDSAAYAGPTMELRQFGGNHVAVFTAPSGGWNARHDVTRRRFDTHEVFVTLRRPGPGEWTSQAPVDHVVDTGGRAAKSVAVEARVVTQGDDAERAPYRLVGRSDDASARGP